MAKTSRVVMHGAVEMYTPERKAEFLLSTATDADDYERAVAEVRKLGFDPKKIKHRKPPSRREFPGRGREG